MWVQTPRRARAAISTIAEPVEPKGLAGFSLCPAVGRINNMSARCGQILPRRQTEIPTDLFDELPASFAQDDAGSSCRRDRRFSHICKRTRSDAFLSLAHSVSRL